MLLATSSHVEAQAWMEDRSRREGPGIRVGNLELHPGVGVEAGYDSNVFLSSEGEQLDSAVMRFTPHLDLSTLRRERRESGAAEHRSQRERKIAFRMGAATPIYLFFSQDVRQRSLVGALGHFDLTVRPDGKISFNIYDSYARHVRPFTEQGADSYSIHRNDVGAVLKAGTKGGVYVAKLGYELGLNVLTDEAFKYLNNAEHRARFSMFWNFFPKTSLYFDSQVSHQVYFNPPDLTDRLSFLVRTAQNSRIKANVGLNGAISAKVAIQAQVGYGAALVYDKFLANRETVLAKLYLTLNPRPTLTLRAGYDRDIHPAFSGVYYTLDRGLIEIETLLRGRVLLGSRVWAGYLATGTVVSANHVRGRDPAPISPDGETRRTDVIVNGSLFGEYRIKDWIAVTLSGAVIYDQTGFRYNRYLLGSLPPDPANYYKFEVWGGMRVFY